MLSKQMHFGLLRLEIAENREYSSACVNQRLERSVKMIGPFSVMAMVCSE